MSAKVYWEKAEEKERIRCTSHKHGLWQGKISFIALLNDPFLN